MMRRTIAVAALAVLLAACDGGAGGDAAAGGAEGEVLGGTISDAMLPLDTVRSQSPALRPEPSEGAAGEDPGEGTDEAPEGQDGGEGDQADEADGPPQIRLDPAPEPEAAQEDGEGTGAAN